MFSGKATRAPYKLDALCEIRELDANTSSNALIHQDFHSGLCLVILCFSQLVKLFSVFVCHSVLRFLAAKSQY